MSDHFFPIKSLVADGYTFLRGYLLILTSNIAFLMIRWLFYEIFSANYDHFSSVSFPAVFLKYSQTVKKKCFKFKVLKRFLPVCVYVLAVGFIQIWRALFYSFGYILKFFEEKYSVNQALSAMAFQLIVAISLAFTRRNNAVNLCPTHETYKLDELQYLDALFNIDNFSFMKEQKNVETGKRKFHLPSFVKQEKTMVSDSIVDPDFDIVKYLTNKLIRSISSSNNDSNNNKKPPTLGLWQIIVDSAESKPTNSMENDTKISRANDTNLQVEQIDKLRPLSSPFFPSTSIHPFPTPTSSLPKITTVKEFQRENTIAWESKKSMVSINFKSDVNKTGVKGVNNDSKVDRLLTMSELTEEQRGYAEALHDISKKRFHQRTNSISIAVEPNHHANPTFRKRVFNKNKVKSETKKDSDWRHLAIEVMGYVYAIHHRQIFLHIFGGMFWSSTWKIFDLITERLFTKTASDIPALVITAVLCHCLNQLVLFRFKETATSVYWKTICELLCGLFTVFLWASLWFVLDAAAAIPTGKIVFCNK